MEIKKSDYDKVTCYLSGALLLYDALAVIGGQKARCRAHMIRQLLAKLRAIDKQ